jgi:glycosyltransferase involved in cell wall biosynthesis
MNRVRVNAARTIHVGVNAHLLSLAESYRGAGINWYIHNLLRHLPEVDPEIRFTVFLSERRFSATPGLQVQLSRLPTHRPPVRILWEQGLQPWALRPTKVQLLHGPAFVGPLLSSVPFVVTVHDLSFLLYPEGFRKPNRLYLTSFTRWSVQRARRVIAVSDSTRRDVVRLYGISPDKVDVVHNGVDPCFQPLPASEITAFKVKQGLPERFLLFVGTLEPRKNVIRLIESYAQLPADRPPLMLVGGKGWLYDEIFARVETLGLGDNVRFAGFVPPEDLPKWYNAATLFVYPSLYEGFGLPPLEAMACGTPVVTSTASSLPEVVGPAGLSVDPTDTEALTEAMDQVLRDQDLQDKMRAAGLVQAQGFSWQETARRTADSYRRALMAGGGTNGV